MNCLIYLGTFPVDSVTGPFVASSLEVLQNQFGLLLVPLEDEVVEEEEDCECQLENEEDNLINYFISYYLLSHCESEL